MSKHRKPSDFTMFPFNSVLRKFEAEQVAVNIMVILARTGDTFRELPWDEYVSERKKDRHFTAKEDKYFHNVRGYCISATHAILFSDVWKGKQDGKSS